MKAGRRLPNIGKYRLLAEIGHGGMAEVFLAVVEGPGQFSKLVALKVLRPQFADDADGRAMFLNEARLAARLSHPNIVQTFEVGDFDNNYVIAMEYLEGQPYSRVLARSRAGTHTPMPLALSLRIVAESLAGLHYAHELKDFDGSPLQLVHRDVSPHNVFITYDGLVKVLDFGIAKAVGGSAETRTGILKGKVGYMAAEQIADLPLDRRVDIYAAGVMLWEVAVGRRAWKGVSDVGILTRVANEGLASPRSVNPEVPAELDRIIMKAVARRRDDRYDTAADFQADLEAFLDTLSEKTSSRAIGKYIGDTFADLHTESKRMVERQLSRAKSIPPEGFDTVTLPNPNLSGSNPSVRSSSLNINGSASNVSIVGIPAAESVPKKAGGGSTLVIAAAVIAALGVGGFFLIRRGAGPETSTPTSTAATLATTSATTSGTSTTTTTGTTLGTGTPTPGVELITLKVSATPADAKIYFDDEALSSNPSEGKLGKDGQQHTVRAEADGYITRTEKVTLDGDKTVALKLEKAPKWHPNAGGKKPPTEPTGTGGNDVKPPPPPPPTNTTTVPPTASTARPIDTDNPFGK
jgi:serine/threonine protein kinase